MATARPADRARGALFAALLCAGVACAGPAEDYADGERSYQRGDVVTAIASLRKAADAGHAKAQVLLAYIFDQSSFDEDAVRYYRMASDQGDADGTFGLAGMYAVGEGVARDEARARELYAKAAAGGHKAALEALAVAYAEGRLGLTPGVRDDAVAVATIKRAAEGGFVPAARALGRAYRNGEFGLAVDVAEAARWEAKVPPSPKPAAKAAKK